ncbi:hypothetical protein IV454_10725 [Massilia antarctica]|uniref:Elongation factor Tu n=1 Tax=Massilia antarctica TaxID=2765360 RepID=A0AA48WHS1_9BURK|nr:hypothetical protein [Massilia antarctica]QPI51922.1 hypothetical protein IV454_10725 [Massilia antarctica]
MPPAPQFTAELTFHFTGQGPERLHCFVFEDGLHRRVPMRMDGVDGLHTVGMWVDKAHTFVSGDTVLVRCVVIAPELFHDVVQPGVQFALWDGGYFASGVVLERHEAGWPSTA